MVFSWRCHVIGWGWWCECAILVFCYLIFLFLFIDLRFLLQNNFFVRSWSLITYTSFTRELQRSLSLENHLILHIEQLFALLVLNERHISATQQLLLLLLMIILLSKLGRNMILSGFSRADLGYDSHFLRGVRMALPGCDCILRISLFVFSAHMMNYNIVSLMIWFLRFGLLVAAFVEIPGF